MYHCETMKALECTSNNNQLCFLAHPIYKIWNIDFASSPKNGSSYNFIVIIQQNLRANPITASNSAGNNFRFIFQSKKYVLIKLLAVHLTIVYGINDC